jgi:hypothetical protein
MRAAGETDGSLDHHSNEIDGLNRILVAIARADYLTAVWRACAAKSIALQAGPVPGAEFEYS